MENGQELREPCETLAVIGAQERAALLHIATQAAMAAGDVVTSQSRRYAECAQRLLKAAIGDPMTLGQAQSLLERWTLLGTPLEGHFTRAIAAIKMRRAAFGDDPLTEGVS